VWTANPNQFVEDEDEKTFAYSVRISAQDLLLVSLFIYLFVCLFIYFLLTNLFVHCMDEIVILAKIHEH
jgi:hypothetical protein